MAGQNGWLFEVCSAWFAGKQGKPLVLFVSFFMRHLSLFGLASRWEYPKHDGSPFGFPLNHPEMANSTLTPKS